MIAVVLAWSALFADLLRGRADTRPAHAQPRGQSQAPAADPAPITTHAS